MGLKERMADASFGMKAQLCAVCKNQRERAFDAEDPARPVMTARPGRHTGAAASGESYVCEYFELDEAKYKVFKDLLPQTWISPISKSPGLPAGRF
jgi:hypothetical protein